MRAATKCALYLLATTQISLATPPAAVSTFVPPPARAFLDKNCVACHNATLKSGNLNLRTYPFTPDDPANFARWVRIHDRVRDGEMPPIAPKPFTAAERDAFLASLATPLMAADKARYATSGRATWRRMNRYEYENTLRDLLSAPWLQIKELLPEDGEAWHYNKSGEALDVSHVHMNQYLSAAEFALREVLPRTTTKPDPATKRYYARDQNSMWSKVDFPNSPERDMFPVVGSTADLAGLRKTTRTVGPSNPEVRNQEGLGVVASTYEPLEIRFNQFTAPISGHYRIRLMAHTMWVGPDKAPRWWKPNPENITAGRTTEPVTLYSEVPPREMRRLGSFDVHPEPTVNELDVYLVKGESIHPDAVRFFRSRPPNWKNPLATEEGQPGVVFQWLEVDGPLLTEFPAAGAKLLFGDLPYTVNAKGIAEYKSANPEADSKRLLTAFIEHGYRRPVPPGDVDRFVALANKSMASGFSFTDAMIAAYTGVLCSPAFVTLEEKPGRLDDYALASRLSYFLWNSGPDAKLRELAAHHELQQSAVLREQTKRMLDDPKSQRFVSAFLDYWLDLRKLNNTSPDPQLYPESYLDDFLVESAGDETRAFFTELLKKNLPSSNIVDSDFAMLNQRLADLYGLPGVTGAAIRRIELPPGTMRGGIMTMASVLKVSANGTSTSPVLRGVWINERILGKPVPPRPTGIPAVETDTRGATTIREQLAKHRSQEVCNSCHSLIDPAGFALENFDVVGAWRTNYRALGESQSRVTGLSKGGLPFEYHFALPVDATGTLPDGRKFDDVRDLKKLFLADERQIARNLATQLITYSTGASVHFSDRPKLEAILDETKPTDYGVNSIVDAIIQSDLFRNK